MSIFLSLSALVAALTASLLLGAADSVSAQTFKFIATAGESATELQRRAAALNNQPPDSAWFGSFTSVQREQAEKFRSVFITTEPPINLRADLGGKTMSFGSQASPSVHLRPLVAALDC